VGPGVAYPPYPTLSTGLRATIQQLSASVATSKFVLTAHHDVINTSRLANNHRLNGSSSPVLTATSLSYGKAKNSTPHRIETPDPIEMKFGTVDYVGEGTCHAKFYANPSKGGFPANG